MNITFINFTIAAGGTPQPLVGTTTSGAILSGTGPQSVAVASSKMFQTNDYAYIDTLGSAEKVGIKVTSDTAITMTPSDPSGHFRFAHSSGAALALFLPISSFTVFYPNGGAAPITVLYNPMQFSPASGFGRGAQAISKTGPVGAIWILNQTVSPGAPSFMNSANIFGSNPDNLCYVWCDGTTGDGYTVSAVIT